MIYRVYTIEDGEVSEGAKVDNFTLAGGATTIQAILVGEVGRGRELGVLPVGNAPKIPCPNRHIDWRNGPDSYVPWGIPKEVYTAADLKPCDKCGLMYEVRTIEGKTDLAHPSDRGEINGLIMAAEIGTTKAGRPKLFAKSQSDADDKVIVVFRTQIGFRGGNSHTGDREATQYELTYNGREKLRAKSQQATAALGEDIVAAAVRLFDSNLLYGKFDAAQRTNLMEVYGLSDDDFESSLEFRPFPGQVIAKGVIAQGDAGRAGSGDQLVAVIPKGIVFRTGYSGRLYGRPAAHYYMFNGEKILSATWEERELTDIF